MISQPWVLFSQNNTLNWNTVLIILVQYLAKRKREGICYRLKYAYILLHVHNKLMLSGTIFWTFQIFIVQSTKMLFTPFSDIHIWLLCFSSLSGWTTSGNVSHRKVAYSFLKSLVSVLFLYFIILIDNPWYTLFSCQICGNGSSFFTGIISEQIQ